MLICPIAFFKDEAELTSIWGKCNKPCPKCHATIPSLGQQRQ